MAARRLGTSIAFFAVSLAGAALAQDYPAAQPIKLLVGLSCWCGGLDISCRHWAQRLGSRIGQQVVVENRPGAAGEIAVKQAIQSKPDGYTLVCLSGSNTISSSKPAAPFDIRSDVSPVIQMNKFTFVLYVNPKARRGRLPSSSPIRRPIPASSTMAPWAPGPRRTSRSST